MLHEKNDRDAASNAPSAIHAIVNGNVLRRMADIQDFTFVLISHILYPSKITRSM